MKKPDTSPAGPSNKSGGGGGGKDIPTAKDDQIPLQSLKDFRFPTENHPPDIATITDDLLTTDNLNNTLTALEREVTAATTGTSKTKASKREKAKKFQKRVVLKIRDLIGRAKKKAQKGGKKLKPKSPALKLKIEMDNPAAAVGDATGLPVPNPPAPMP